ncbi:MAG TPA: penicillin-binding transpeptidase domain-containing protein [Sedimentisphaerales bacterium]|nr:penicillin-binding transpeptidase domain-containing protein [Sedimentisphaerales bacterium]
MYDKRIKIFIILVATLLFGCLLRLAQMQLLSHSFYRDRIAELKLEQSRYRQLRTLRGRILDRNSSVLAVDEPRFELCINYRLTALLDGRVQQQDTDHNIKEKLDDLRQVVEKCARLKGVDANDIRREIETINDSIWNQRTFQAWRRNFPDSPLLKKYASIENVPLDEAMREFEARADRETQRKLVNRIDIAEMHMSWPLLDLQTDDDIFTAQLEFMDSEDIGILPKGHRTYPYAAAAAQTIGWVGRPQEDDRNLLAADRLARYLEDDVCGREDGVEYVCESLLRGRRGEAVYDIDRQLVRQTPTQFGADVTLTIDIELQQKIENYFGDPNLNTNSEKPTAAVVIDVASGEILALVSLPTYDLNRARYEYGNLLGDAKEPMRNRALYKQYPPGSVIKPIILIAGLESGKITPHTAISCPGHAAPKGWPSCWIWLRYKSGHDYDGPNIARDAIKHSCNIFFSRLADMIDTDILQNWLYKFGYGSEIPLAPPLMDPNDPVQNDPQNHRDFRQAPGIVCSPDGDGKISPGERRWFGIGQGNLRVTPLQVANAMAAIARGGIYQLPTLFVSDPNNPAGSNADSRVSLGISSDTLDVVVDGMHAVVNERGGTANSAFKDTPFAQRAITVYGKTGSTERPDNAWFAGFAADSRGRAVALAVVVEGGQHGSSDAAPLAKEMIRLCADAAYLGEPAQ